MLSSNALAITCSVDMSTSTVDRHGAAPLGAATPTVSPAAGAADVAGPSRPRIGEPPHLAGTAASTERAAQRGWQGSAVPRHGTAA